MVIEYMMRSPSLAVTAVAGWQMRKARIEAVEGFPRSMDSCSIRSGPSGKTTVISSRGPVITHSMGLPGVGEARVSSAGRCFPICDILDNFSEGLRPRQVVSRRVVDVGSDADH